ncbi:MAG: methyltransferase domain-containing protein [Acidobacteria bacterium]|nr:methyltransferase domain-containing protein [Acidobacteriota bacterium]
MLRFVLTVLLAATLAAPATAQQSFKPEVGQAGKDVVWVPTVPALVEKMLDLAKVTPDDFVIDLGSGDGRMVIAAARRGARALGVEFNPDMVQLSRQLAAEAGVGEKATFVEGDMFEADISKATVLALFLLPDNLARLEPKFRALKPGTRIVVNTFGIPGWEPDVTEQITGDCSSWCTAMLYHVPPSGGRERPANEGPKTAPKADRRNLLHL